MGIDKVVFLSAHGPLYAEEERYAFLGSYYGVDVELPKNSSFEEFEKAHHKRDEKLGLASQKSDKNLSNKIIIEGVKLNEESLKNFEILTNETNCSYVITSFWKDELSFDDLKKTLYDKGFTFPINGVTEKEKTKEDEFNFISGYERAQEIHNYVKEQHLKEYIIIDSYFHKGYGDISAGRRRIATQKGVIITQNGFTSSCLEKTLDAFDS